MARSVLHKAPPVVPLPPRSCKDLDLRPLQGNFRAFPRKEMLLFFLHSMTSKHMCEKVHDVLASFLPTFVPMEPCCWNIQPTLSAQRRSTWLTPWPLKLPLEQLRWDIECLSRFLSLKMMWRSCSSCLCVFLHQSASQSPHRMQFARDSEHRLPKLHPFIWCPWLQQHHNEFVQYQYAMVNKHKSETIQRKHRDRIRQVQTESSDSLPILCDSCSWHPSVLNYAQQRHCYLKGDTVLCLNQSSLKE